MLSIQSKKAAPIDEAASLLNLKISLKNRVKFLYMILKVHLHELKYS